MDRKREIMIMRAIEDCYFALDTAAPQGIARDEWIGIVAGVVNDMDSYDAWTKEVWS